MKQLLSIAALFAVLAFGALVFAQDNLQSNNTKSRKNLAKTGSGVCYYETNKKGEITYLLVVGKADVNPRLDASIGKTIAQRKASLDCDAEFAKWSQYSLTVVESPEGKDIIVFNSKNDDDETLAEDDKSKEITKQKISRYIRDSIRCMEVMYAELDKETNEYTIIKALNRKNVNKDIVKYNADNVNKAEEIKAAPKTSGEDDVPAPGARNSLQGGVRNAPYVLPNAG